MPNKRQQTDDEFLLDLCGPTLFHAMHLIDEQEVRDQANRDYAPDAESARAWQQAKRNERVADFTWDLRDV